MRERSNIMVEITGGILGGGGNGNDYDVCTIKIWEV